MHLLGRKQVGQRYSDVPLNGSLQVPRAIPLIRASFSKKSRRSHWSRRNKTAPLAFRSTRCWHLAELMSSTSSSCSRRSGWKTTT